MFLTAKEKIKETGTSFRNGCFTLAVVSIVILGLLGGFYIFLDKGERRVTNVYINNQYQLNPNHSTTEVPWSEPPSITTLSPETPERTEPKPTETPKDPPTEPGTTDPSTEPGPGTESPWPPSTDPPEEPETGTTDERTDEPTDPPFESSTETTEAPEPPSNASVEMGKRLMANMDFSVDPCSDFYQFACGKFELHNELPDGKGQFTSLDQVAKKVRNTIVNNLSSEGPPDELQPIKFIREIYQRAGNQTVLEKNNLSKLRKIRAEVRKLRSVEEVVQFSILNAVPTIFSFKIIQDPEDSSKGVVMLDQPLLPVAKEILIDQEPNAAYKAYYDFVRASIELFYPAEYAPYDLTNAILATERAMAKYSTSDADRRDPGKTMKRFEKNSLPSHFKGIDLPKVIDYILGPNTVDTVIVADVKYFENLNRLLAENEIDALYDLAAWRLMQAYAWTLSQQFNDAMFEYLQKTEGITEKPDVKETVLQLLYSKVPYLMGRLYIDAVGFGEDDKAKVNELVDKLIKTFNETIGERGWLDDQTRKLAQNKLQRIRKKIGYPDWIEDDIQLMRSLPLRFRSSDDTFDMLFKLNKFLFLESFRKLEKTEDGDREWSMSPALVKAAYSRSLNSITLPAALLRGTFFHSGRPEYVNGAAIGSILAHEITHSFDQSGSQFGPDGRMENWWTDDTREKFGNLTQKMTDMYSSIVEPWTGLKLNGVNTCQEDIADHMAILMAYRSFYSRETADTDLLGLRGWSKEKLFFLSYANLWCGDFTKEELKRQIKSDSNSPVRYRVNVPLSNLQYFAYAFKCPRGSKMHPKAKVKVW